LLTKRQQKIAGIRCERAAVGLKKYYTKTFVQVLITRCAAFSKPLSFLFLQKNRKRGGKDLNRAIIARLVFIIFIS
jgi:hypothetical protein